MSVRQTDEQRRELFYATIDMGPHPKGCHVWRIPAPACSHGGYGRFTWQGKRRPAHVVAWVLTNGEIPDKKLFVLHTCDNPLCCNVDHLWLGNNLANMRDMIAKGRALFQTDPERLVQRGKKPKPDLTYDAVSAMRKKHFAGARIVDLSLEYGVCCSQVSKIVNGRAWVTV